MLYSYLALAYRNLLRQQGYAAINILGLAIGMACAILIYLYVDFETSWDSFRPNADRVYRVLRVGPTSNVQGRLRKPFEGLSGAVGPALVRDYPEVEETTRVRIGARWIRYGEYARRTTFWFSDTNFFDFFGVRLARGNPETALTEPNGVVLNPEIVKEFFGDEDPLGKTINCQDGDYIVTGILEPLPRNSMIHFNFVTGTVPQNIRNRASWDDFRQSPRRRQTVTFIRLRQGADPKALEAKLPAFASTILPEADRSEEKFVLQGFLRMRLHVREDFPTGLDGLASGMGQGNPAYLRTLALIGAAVLAIGCLNFMNLATARSIGRSKEVGLRKSVGALRSSLIGQFMTESLLTVSVSLPLAIGLTHLALPAWRSFVGYPVTFDLGDASVLAGLAGITLFVGFIAGTYPAFYLSTFDPARSLRGVTAVGGGTFRKPLVVVQFALAVILVLGTFVATRQLSFVRGKNLGFNRDNILAIRIFDNDSSLRPKYQMVKDRFSRHPAVIQISASASLPGEGWTSSRQAYEPVDNRVEFEMRNFSIDEDWFPYIGVDFVAGRNFSPDFRTDSGEGFILNETAVQRLGLKDPVGAPFRWGDKQGHIIGVVTDHHTRDLYVNIGPCVFVLEPRRYRVVTLRFHPDRLDELMDFVTRTWKELIPERPLVYAFLDDRLEREYRRDVRFQNICAVAFGLAIFVACLGLVGLAAFTAERRSKEIGIRKAIGASERTIVILLTNEFARLVIVANLVAWPIAYFVMDDWLTKFAYRIDQGVGPYAAAGILSLTLALITVGYQAWRAALLDPVDTLRDE